jgi:O-antigen ligase
MVISFVSTAVFLLLGISLPIHAIGGWLLILVLHGVLVGKLGDAAVHVPMAVGIGVVAALLVTNKWSGVRVSAFLLIAALVILMVIASVLGIDFAESSVALVQYGKSFLLALVLGGCLRQRKDFELMSWYLVAAVAAGAAIAVYQHLTGHYAINTEYVQRAAGLRGDPNDTAMILVAGVPIGVYWLLQAPNILWKSFWAGILMLILLGIIWTGSRGGFVALAAVALALFVKRPSINMVLLGIVLVVAFAAMAPRSYWERMGTLATGKESHGGRSLNNRLELQRRGLQILMANPILGIGPGNFGTAFASIKGTGGLVISHKPKPTDDRSFAVAHNLHLEFFVENGFVAGALLWGLFGLTMRELIRFDSAEDRKQREIGLGFSIALALGSMLLAGLFLSQGKNSVLWFLIGMGVAAYKLNGDMAVDKSVIPAKRYPGLLGSGP